MNLRKIKKQYGDTVASYERHLCTVMIIIVSNHVKLLTLSCNALALGDATYC